MAATIPPLDDDPNYDYENEVVPVIRHGRVYPEFRKNVNPGENIADIGKLLDSLILPDEMKTCKTYAEVDALLLSKEPK